MESIIGDFDISGEFGDEPYITCLFDVSNAMPKSIALRAHHLDEGHNFQVNELGFYYEILKAERHAIKNLLELLDRHALHKDASKTYIWMLEAIYKDQANVSEKIKKLVQDDVNKARNENAINYVKSLVVDNAQVDEHTFYERLSTH